MLGILFGSFLSQPMTALAITNNQEQSEKTESVQNEQENETRHSRNSFFKKTI